MDLGLARRVAVVTGASQGIRQGDRPLLPLGVTMQISTTPGLPRRRSPRLAHHVAI